MTKINQQFWLSLLLAILLCCGILFCFFRLDFMPLFDRDEGEYTAVLSTMQSTGNYIIPYLNGHLYIEKPILFFWSMSVMQALGGKGEIVARLPSAISICILSLFIGWLVIYVSGIVPLAILSSVATIFTPLMSLIGRSCLTDMLLTLFTTISIGIFFIVSEKKINHRLGFLIFWFFLGLAFLTKGPVALIIILLPILFFLLFQRRLIEIIKKSQLLLGLLIFFSINLPWYGLIFYYLGEDFWRGFFISQNLRRFNEVLLGHGGGIFYYFSVLALGGFPYSAVYLPTLGKIIIKNTRQFGLQTNISERLCLLAVIVVIVTTSFFTLASTKQINYILPAMPFLSLLASYTLWDLSIAKEKQKKISNIIFFILIFLSSLWIIIFFSIPLVIPLFWENILSSIRPDSSEYALPIEAPKLLFWPLLGILTISFFYFFIFLLIKFKKKILLGFTLGLGSLFLCLIINMGILPQVANLIQTPARCMAIDVRNHLPQSVRVIFYGLWKPSLLYYLGREIDILQAEEYFQLKQLLIKYEPLIIFTRVSLVTNLTNIAEFKPLAFYGGYLLGANKKAMQLWINSYIK